MATKILSAASCARDMSVGTQAETATLPLTNFGRVIALPWGIESWVIWTDGVATFGGGNITLSVLYYSPTTSNTGNVKLAGRVRVLNPRENAQTKPWGAATVLTEDMTSTAMGTVERAVINITDNNGLTNNDGLQIALGRQADDTMPGQVYCQLVALQYAD